MLIYDLIKKVLGLVLFLCFSFLFIGFAYYAPIQDMIAHPTANHTWNWGWMIGSTLVLLVWQLLYKIAYD